MVDIHDLYAGILSNVHKELPHRTMDKKLIINVAPTGSFMNRPQNPGQPYTMERQGRNRCVPGRRGGVACSCP
jgi:hypothetical protein